MMASSKPVSYPNLVESISELADMHAQIHNAVSEHATDHQDGIAAKRRALQLQHAASKLLEKK